MIAFVPAYTGLVAYGFYALVAVLAFIFTRRLLRLFVAHQTPSYLSRLADVEWVSILFSLLICGVTVYLLMPRLWEYHEVHEVVKPGVPFSTVVEKLGQPSWKSKFRNGDVVNGYDTGLVIGSVTVTVSPDGLVNKVSYAD